MQFVSNFGRTIRKMIEEGGGGLDFFGLPNFFLHVHDLVRIFFSGGCQGLCTISFGGGGGQDGYSTVTILIFTRHNLIACNRLETNTVFYLPHSRFVKQVSDSVLLKAAIAQLMELHCIFCLMSRENIVFFTPSPSNTIHSWHAVTRGFN